MLQNVPSEAAQARLDSDPMFSVHAVYTDGGKTQAVLSVSRVSET